MNNKIQLSNNKVIKLTNVLIQEINIQENDDFNKLVLHMENYIKFKGATPIGPSFRKLNTV